MGRLRLLYITTPEEPEDARLRRSQLLNAGVHVFVVHQNVVFLTTPEEPEDARLRRSQLLNAGVHVFIVHRVVVFLTTPEQPEDASFKRSQPPLPSSLVGSVNDRRHRVALRCCLRNNSGKNLFKQSTSTSGTFPRLLCTFFENVLDPAPAIVASVPYQGKGEKQRRQQLVNVCENESQLPNTGGTAHGPQRSVQTCTHGNQATTLPRLWQSAAFTDNGYSLWFGDVFWTRVQNRM